MKPIKLFLILIVILCAYVEAFAELSIIHYQRAYELIYHRLYYHKNIPFKDFIFAIENAYLGDTADYDAYNREIDYMVSSLRRQANIYAAYEPTMEMALLRAICSCYSEPNEANRGTPFSYDMLPTIERNYPHYGLVTTLLQTGRGTCRSLPFLLLGVGFLTKNPRPVPTELSEEIAETNLKCWIYEFYDFMTFFRRK